MQDTLQPLIHKAPVMGLRVNVTQARLCIGDTAALRLLTDGQIGIFAQASRRFLGSLRPKSLQHLGNLGPAGAAIIGQALQEGRHLRVRIVGLTPEHLAQDSGAEVWISVWGDASSLSPIHLGPNIHPPAAQRAKATLPDQPSGRA